MKDTTERSVPGPTERIGDEALLDLVQRQTFGFFWDYAHQRCGMALDRAPADGSGGNDLIAVGGTGFGIMAILVAAERGWIARSEALDRISAIVRHLEAAERYNGVFPHYMDGCTGKEVAFWADNAGGDIVETSYLVQGLLTARQYFRARSHRETVLRNRIESLWREVNWNWHTKGEDVLFWHRSPKLEREPPQTVRGWNECLITYVLAASSPTYPIAASAYREGWAKGDQFANGKAYYGIELPLGPDYGGPLFFAHYSFLGLDPRGLEDRYANYWEQNRRHTLINYEHCVRNPNKYAGYGPDCWGLTASDGDEGYYPHAPDVDRGVITPTAALGSMPYTPEQSMQALRHFYFDRGPRIWGKYGFADAFNPATGWVASDNLAIDQGPIVVMIENYRTGLLWRLFMSCPEVRQGLQALGFKESSAIA
ncbi:MAG: glucoamylase family protein [Rhodomicrobium sp.]